MSFSFVCLLQLDAKKSPLALLAQTCSQIGADSPTKNMPATQDKPKKERTSPKAESAKPISLAFKPYETNVVTKKKEERRKSVSPGKGCPTPAKSSGSASGSPAPESKDGGASPIIRSGMEVLEGLKGGCPPGLEANPAFRPPYALYPGWVYPRTKDGVLPVCKDPYCSGCALGGPVHPAPCACAQCEQQKYLGLIYLRPYVCSWIASDKYCGQRFSTSEELLAHLRSHTAPGEPPLLAPSALAPPGLPRYPAAALHPRYHPYSKPTLPLPLALAPYYPYLYPQRLPVHP